MEPEKRRVTDVKCASVRKRHMLRDRKLVCEEERKIEAGQGQSGRKEGIGRPRKREGQTEAEENKGRENVRGDEQEGGRSSAGGEARELREGRG